jgi:L-lactate dehydrogenase complex protein LldE
MNPMDHGRAVSKKVQLMATCLCDAFFDETARATVEVLEHLGCEIEFPQGQTCCGQPAFNAGDWAAARSVLRHAMRVFKGEDPIILPSGSCAAMIFHSSLLAFEKEPDLPEVRAIARRTWELSDFVVNGLGVERWPGRFPARIAFHHSCHTRGTGSPAAAERLLRSIDGVQIVPFDEPEQCCGFGGTFSVAFPYISSQMGKLKLDNALKTKPDYLVSNDMSCLMHLRGLAEKEGQAPQVRHTAQILSQALRSKGGS